MELGYILSLIILGVSLVILIVMGFFAMKKMRPTLKNIEETQKVVEGHMEHFTHEAELIQDKVDHIMTRVDYTKNVSEMKIQRFDEFSKYASSLSESLMYLKEHGGDYSKGVAENTINELKTDGPVLAKTFKLAFKKTVDKQKMRRHTDPSAQVPAVIHHELANIER
ncbi:DUF948 domain-containing protein [Alkalibacterium olivapovliticus]|uniref:Uncharacterized protein YoxC n=1 Tax=Alkalibacterium olivapovliticus TaxID=99907 RepID=A0A2T0W5S7_9LACT|nr:hypothetical protein [Alkalibacterium olivapovliticus]PRY81427.1 uncharacterized protein YoxC [Alkalibacterium olivapovliticus]